MCPCERERLLSRIQHGVAMRYLGDFSMIQVTLLTPVPSSACMAIQVVNCSSVRQRSNLGRTINRLVYDLLS